MINKNVVGILAHVDAGKTTLSEALLYTNGIINKLGRVDNKNAYLDNDIVEKERGITIYSKNARLRLDKRELILIDTPGHVDFSTEMERALSVLDSAILLISGSEGIQSHTKTLWKLLDLYHIPTLIFVNKMDMITANKDELLASLKSSLSSSIVDFTNEDLSDDTLEEIASSSEELMETYLDTGSISDELISKAIGSRALFPVYFGSALKLEGVKSFSAGLDRYLPSLADNMDAPFGAIVYKISRDSQGKRLTFMKITSGNLKIKTELDGEKINEIRIYSGTKYESVKEVSAGDICAVVGLANTQNGNTYGASTKAPSQVLAPAISYAVHFPPEVDKNKMLSYLRELEEEDPSLSVDYKEETKEIFVSLMGDIQAEVLKRTIMDRYSIGVSFGEGKVCYKETILGSAEGIGHFEPLRHYAEAHIKLEPLERGSGIIYDTDVSENLLDKNWQRLILTHMMERSHRGVLTGSPITDVKLTLVAGKAHIKHTEGGDFRQATYRAIRQGLMQLLARGECLLLEPYYDYTLEIPETYVGRAMTDITSMCGSSNIAENDYENHITVLTGRAPVSAMNGYSKEVLAYTKGLGKLSLVVSGYDTCHNMDEAIGKRRYNPDNDLHNPTGSVFCSHGAGTIIPWDEVDKYMHLDYSSETNSDSLVRADAKALAAAKEANRLRQEREAKTSSGDFISTTEIDNILRASSHANEKGRQESYKGISAAMRLRRRNEEKPLATQVTYKGTASKEKYMLVDGYNVIHCWQELKSIAKDSLDGAVSKLNDILSNYQAIHEMNLTIVYDAYRIKGHQTEKITLNNINVVYTKEDQTADQYIEQYVNKYGQKQDITVVTSDALERLMVSGDGAYLISSNEFERVVNQSISDFNEKYCKK